MKETDLWETPAALYKALDEEFKFTLDLTCNRNNCKVAGQTTFRDIFGRESLPINEVCFMNPPYSNPYPFIEKVISLNCKAVCLLPVDTSTKWWALFWDYDKHSPKEGFEVRFLPKRLKFERDGVPAKSCFNKASCIVIAKGGVH